jgi:SMI1 / KNR4 family (SUKH-1)
MLTWRRYPAAILRVRSVAALSLHRQDGMSDDCPVERAVTRLIAAGLADPATIRGCRGEEIDRIEKDLGMALPASYRRFLMKMGRSAGAFLSGTDFLLADLGGLRAQAELLLHEAKMGFHLKDTDFVFAVHQGYQFLFFDTAEPDDPAVWLYAEGDVAPRQVFGHFSQWLDACVSDEIAAGAAR